MTSVTAELGIRPQGQKWGSDHPSLLHWQKTVEDLTRAKGSYFYAMRLNSSLTS